MDGNLKGVGVRIRDARKKRGLSQAELAERLNISLSHMGDIETGRTNFGVDILMRITEVLQISADLLLRTDVPEVNAIFASEFQEITEGCTISEKEAMLQTLRSMKAVFIDNRKRK
ncbi:helix-turn-helix domain-containing protein [Succiniclasticum ruminis]|uniref:Helix-turn-helix n=1 Tax=Succiniclasticum ruminis DSM 9236 TaxID=1123323 RepID=A0A1I2E9G3_9FIRM|nr:helix-turn-helix transcriptional regulator [Succiniclasticum ruminis]SFE89289.1 Helix-turn-helix [Succiniclasticum ruminis DSM 9236]